jgi:hypothetical protein
MLAAGHVYLRPFLGMDRNCCFAHRSTMRSDLLLHIGFQPLHSARSRRSAHPPNASPRALLRRSGVPTSPVLYPPPHARRASPCSAHRSALGRRHVLCLPPRACPASPCSAPQQHARRHLRALPVTTRSSRIPVLCPVAARSLASSCSAPPPTQSVARLLQRTRAAAPWIAAVERCIPVPPKTGRK